MRKGRRYEAAFDVVRYEDPDTTLETVLDPDTSASTTFNLLDTSRRPEYDVSRSSRDLSANNSFNKLPDDNMNSELTRSTDFQLDNSKILPTLQPNGWGAPPSRYPELHWGRRPLTPDTARCHSCVNSNGVAIFKSRIEIVYRHVFFTSCSLDTVKWIYDYK